MTLSRLILLTASLALPFAAVLVLPLGVLGIIAALCCSALFMLAHVVFASASILDAHGARPIETFTLASGGSGALGVKPLVHRLAFRLGVPEPDIYMYGDVDSRVFSVGTRYRHKIAVSSGLLATLNAEELEAVLCREMLRFSHFRARNQTTIAALGCTFGRLFIPKKVSLLAPRMFLIIFFVPFFAALSKAIQPHPKLTLIADDEAARSLPQASPLASALRKMAKQPETCTSLPLTVRIACAQLYPVPHSEARPWVQGWVAGFKGLDFQSRIGRLMGWTAGSHG